MKKAIFGLILGLLIANPVFASLASDYSGVHFGTWYAKDDSGAQFDYSKLGLTSSNFKQAFSDYQKVCLETTTMHLATIQNLSSDGSLTKEQSSQAISSENTAYSLKQPLCETAWINLDGIVKKAISAENDSDTTQVAPTNKTATITVTVNEPEEVAPLTKDEQIAQIISLIQKLLVLLAEAKAKGL